MRRLMLLSPIAVLALAQGAQAQTADRYSIPGDVVAIYNLAGDVTIERGTGSNVVVEVTRGGADASSLEVDRREADGRPALVVRYPKGDVVYDGHRGSAQVTVRSDGTFGGGLRGDRVTIRSSGHGTEAHADIRILVPAGKSVDMRLGVGTVTASNVEGGIDIDVHAANVRTRDTKGRLRIDTGSGSVAVSNAEGDEILVDTGSGSVEVNGIRASDLSVDTGSGRVTGSGIVATDLHVDTGSGSIELTNVTARDIELDTGSGGVELDLAAQMDRVLIDTGSGAVRLSVPAGLSASIEAESGSGGIDTNLPITVSERDRTSLRGRIGNGSGSIEIDTGSGGISIVARR